MARSLRTLVVAGLAGLAAPLLITTTASAAPPAPASTAVVTAPAATTAAAASKHVTVPSGYVYKPNATYQRSLHDYCTSSPDSFPTWGKNANFRGPCARHDMCIQYRQAAHRSTCDARLLANLRSECRYTYGWLDPRRGNCLSVASVYWAVVRVKTATSAKW